jgi:hypothetical protein
MRKCKDTALDPKKFLDPGRIRINLLLSALYLTAFEILKHSIIEGTEDFFLDQDGAMTDEEAEQWKEILDETIYDEIVEGQRKQYERQVEEYKREINTTFDSRDQYGLIPSCRWLQKMGALDENEVDEIKKIRDHRNEIAHELPCLLIGEGFEVNLTHFEEIGKLLRKVDAFWARSTLLVGLETSYEVNIGKIPDEELFSGNIIVLNTIINTVIDYFDQVKSK